MNKNPPLTKLIQAGLWGGVALVLNLMLYFLGNTLNQGPMTVDVPGPPPLQALPIFPVIMLSLVPGLIAGLLYGSLKHFTKNARVIFLLIATLVFALMFVNPFMAAQSTTTLWILQIMHVMVALLVIGFIFRADK